MAWLQNLAGRAEDLLNKIDKNAAHVLNDTTQSHPKSFVEETVLENVTTVTASQSFSGFPTAKSNSSLTNYLSNDEDTFHDNASIDIEQDTDDNGLILTIENEKINIESGRSKELSNISSKSSSLQNSFILTEDVENYEERISKLEQENQELNKDLLKIKHQFAEIQNENANLQMQIERANEAAQEAQIEMKKYRARAHRILQEKERLINARNENHSENDNEVVINTYNEELKKELEFHQQRCMELTEKHNTVLNELSNLQKEYVAMQKTHQQNNQRLQETITNERKFRITAEEECRIKSKELITVTNEVRQLQNQLQEKTQEFEQLKQQLKQNVSYKPNDEVESRILNLTQTLLTKQSTLETVTTERNALRLQLEKLENEYHKNLASQRSQIKISNTNETDDVKSQLPRAMQPSVFDAGMTRRVKHAYSTLDALSIRSGMFLRRYPVARVFVLCYMVLLHFWVMIILFTYIPSGN